MDWAKLGNAWDHPRVSWVTDANGGTQPVKVVVAGGTGFLGSALTAKLHADGHSVLVLSRQPQGTGQIEWSPDGTVGAWAAALDGADAVINLAGESLATGRWTTERKTAIDHSRVHATRSLATAIKDMPTKPGVFLSASAIGYYGPRDEEPLGEDAPAGTTFLANVCNQWEWEAQIVAGCTRVVLLRTGLVLDGNGGALPQIARPFRFFVGGPVGNGSQYWSWIHIADWVGMALWAMNTAGISGPINVTAPEPVTNREFASTLGRVMRRPSLMPAPAPALRIALGEMADALLLTGQRVMPTRAQSGGYEFRFTRLEAALKAALEPGGDRSSTAA